MKYEQNIVRDIKIAYIGGGSRGWAWKLMADLAPEGQMEGQVALYDIDFERAATNEKIGNRLSARSEVRGKWAYKAVKTLEEALTGADFVIASVLPGTFDEMESDVHTPEKYGIYQSVGDTAGPGGIIRALRTMPIFENIANKVRECCPDAWVINYTNPMTLCMRTLYEVFPGIKAFGCCHEVFSTQKMLAEMLKENGYADASRSDVKTNVLGINHFTWINAVTWHNQDLMSMYARFAEKYAQSGWGTVHTDNEQERFFNSKQRVKFDLFKKFGVIAAAGDRHLAEFVPQWYLQSPEMARSWDFDLTPVSWRKKNVKELLARSKSLADGAEEIDLSPSGEEGVLQIKALLGLGPLITNVNLPNRGQMAGVPYGAVVETNAVFRDNSIQPVVAGSLPDSVQNLVMRHVYNQEAVVKGFVCRDREMIFRAFMCDPAMKLISEKDCRTLFDTMVENTKAYVPKWLLA